MNDSIKILLIEDNPADARLIDIYLKESYKSHYSLSVVDLLSKGLDLLNTDDFDIIIIDLSLPDSSGIDTFKDVFAAADKKPVMVLTGLEDESVGINTVKLGAQDFLIKGKLRASAARQRPVLRRAVPFGQRRAPVRRSSSPI